MVEKEFILKGKPAKRLRQEATKKVGKKFKGCPNVRKYCFFSGKQTGIIPEFHFLQAGIDLWP